jgi:polyisoprenoid-binding protein YceI
VALFNVQTLIKIPYICPSNSKTIIMKKMPWMVLALVGVLGAACNNNANEAGDVAEAAEAAYTVDSTAVLNWKGDKPFVKDYGHGGTVALVSGEFTLDTANQLASGTFVFDMASILCTDAAMEQAYKDKLVGHLTSADFFDAATYPTASFAVTKYEMGTVYGNLTIKDSAVGISFPATLTVTDSAATLTAPEFKIDRKQWGVSFASSGIVGLAKDQLINDEIALSFELKAKRTK